MSATVLQFSPYLQEPMEAGVLTPVLAWTLEMEFERRQGLPWLPGMEFVNQLVSLWHWTPESLPQ